jgi:ATP-dependent Clp protease ATP-binding subunit ClpA
MKAKDPEPIGNFLFLGPTGTGKTCAMEATAEALLDQHHTNSLKLSFVLFDEIEKASDALDKIVVFRAL